MVDAAPIEAGRLVGSTGVRPLPGPGGSFEVDGWPSYLEYAFDPATPARARRLSLRAEDDFAGIEVWWAAEGGRFTELRSIRWRPDPARAPRDWSVDPNRLPHWDATRGARIRVYYRFPGKIRVAPPIYLR